MPYSDNKIICFNSSDFTDGRPEYSATGSTYSNNPLFANETITLNLGTSIHGYAAFRVTFTGSSVQYISVTFLHPDGQPVSVSTTNGAIFSVSSLSTNVLNFITYDYGVNNINEFLVIVNGLGVNFTDRLNIAIAVGVNRNSLSSLPLTCVNLEYNCPLPIYSAETGLHTYSAYDAIYENSRLKTILYSLTPINSWVPSSQGTCDGTRIFNNSFCQNPALPYYYGIGDYVFKVGLEYDRAYGTQVWYSSRKKLFGPTRTTKHIDGPQWWGPYDPNNEPYSPSCVVPKMGCLGRIKYVYTARDLTKPKQYRYYMGYGGNYPIDNQIWKRWSDESVFRYWYPSRETTYQILGSTHALGKIGQGAFAGMDTIPGYPNGLTLSSADNVGFLGAGAFLATVSTVLGIGTTLGWFATACGIGGAIAFPIAAIVGIIIGVLLILFAIFIPKKKNYREDCVNFLHHFTDTPYLSAGTNTSLYRNVGNTVTNTGWHSDGIYFYYQSNGVITQKEQVFIYEYNEPTDSFEFRGSIIPDSPTLVTDFYKLIILPYVSGKPLPYCNGRIYYNELLTAPIIPPGKCCTLEVCSGGTLSIEAGTVYSCISIDDANSIAQEMLNSSVIYAQNNYAPIQLLNENQLGILNCNFTHELKIETTPTQVSLFFDGRNGLTPRVNTTLYYEDCGCTEVLDGYYAVSGTSNYRVFYKTVGGRISNIYNMLSSNSTTTTTGEPIIFTNLDYSSNWYLTGSTQSTLNYYSNYLINNPTNRNFSPNQLLNNYTVNYPTPPGNPYTYRLVKGFIKTPTTHNNFQLYNDYVTTSYSEAPSGWYRPLIDWITEDSFYYIGTDSRNIYVNIRENCGFMYNSTLSRNAYIIFTNSQGAITQTDVALTITSSIFDTNGTLINTYYSNVPQGTTYFLQPFYIPVSSNVGLITITNIQLNGSSISTYSIGTCRTCTTKICNQLWMTNNLTTKKYRNGDIIPQVTNQATWTGLTTGAWCYYNNDPNTENDYGLLYNHYAITDPRGLAPTGYHVPSESEFNTLTTCLSGDIVAGGKLKETTNYLTVELSHWTPPNLGAIDQVRFTALPSGYRSGGNGLFYQLGQSTSYFTSNVGGGTSASVKVLTYNATSFPFGITTKNSGFSVRCIKD
jgi:uncharacterized protein (TIGR02145 family)